MWIYSTIQQIVRQSLLVVVIPYIYYFIFIFCVLHSFVVNFFLFRKERKKNQKNILSCMLATAHKWFQLLECMCTRVYSVYNVLESVWMFGLYGLWKKKLSVIRSIEKQTASNCFWNYFHAIGKATIYLEYFLMAKYSLPEHKHECEPFNLDERIFSDFLFIFIFSQCARMCFSKNQISSK